MGIVRRETAKWAAPLDEMRARHGLPPAGNPLIEGQYSPHLNLALFSRVMAEPQADWPARTRVTGFVFYNGPASLSPELESFLAAGPRPVVFTLGSSAVGAAGRFYHESAEAAARLGVRAVLLTGGFAANRPARVPDGVLLVDRAPHQLLFPRARAVVHQGGAGTTAQALRAGCPMLVVPHSHDQPDNAWRVARLGVARTLYPKRYTAARAASELQRLLDDPSYAARAREAAVIVAAEGGAHAAADAIQELSCHSTTM
jgi:UDP:flavonoid glycosyltransferase YjiC (YdhE family)